jgi:hypothetical protein
MVLLASAYDQSRFFKAADLQQEKKLRIKSVTEETIGTGAEKEKKLVCWFTNDARGLVLNRVNNRTLRGAFGDATEGWADKVIVLFPTTAEFRGRMMPACRVRIPPPKQVAALSGNGATATTKPADPEVKPMKVDDDLDDELPEALRWSPWVNGLQHLCKMNSVCRSVWSLLIPWQLLPAMNAVVMRTILPWSRR